MWPFTKTKKAEAEKPEPGLGEWTNIAKNKILADASVGKENPPLELEALKTELASLATRAQAESAFILPFEKQSIHALKLLALTRFLDSNFNRLDLSILKWRKKFNNPNPKSEENFAPVFGVFNPFSKDNTCTIKVQWSGVTVDVGNDHWPQLDQFFIDFRESCRFDANYLGFLPDHVRTSFKSLHDLNLGMDFFIIAECDWTKKVLPPDPLAVVGLNDTAWLLAAYDTTTLEHIASSEFGWKEKEWPKNGKATD